MLRLLSSLRSGVPVKPIRVASGSSSRIASWSFPDCVRWHSSTKTKTSPCARNSRGRCRRMSSTKTSTSPSSVTPNLWMSEQTSHSPRAPSTRTRSAPLLVRRMSSPTPLKTVSIWSSSSVRSVTRSTRAPATCSRIHLASQTIVRLLPLPWVCQTMPPSRRSTRSWAARTPKYWLWRQIFLTPASKTTKSCTTSSSRSLPQSCPSSRRSGSSSGVDTNPASFHRSQCFSGVSITL